MPYIIAVLIFVALVSLFIILWRVNRATPTPDLEGVNLAECSGCANKSCGHNPANKS